MGGFCLENFTDKEQIIVNFIEFFDSNLSITSVGYDDFNHILPFERKRVQNFNTVHFVLSGKGVLEIYGKRHKVKQYDMFLIPEKEMVRYFPDNNDPWTYVWIDFVGDNASLLIDRMGFSREVPFFECNSPYSVYLLAKEFFDKFESTGEVGYFSALALFYSIIDINTNLEKVKAMSLREQVVSYIGTHYHDANLKISDICKFFNISHSHLCDLFKGGNTVKEILTMRRVEEAKRLLIEGDLLIGEIAWSVGFVNADHFMKVFKEKTGMAAGEYRRIARNEKRDDI